MGRVTRGSDGMSKTKQRRIERLSEMVDQILETDRRFFRRRPERHYRVRRAARAEVDLLDEMTGQGRELPAGRVLFTSVHGIVPGRRSRVFFHAEADFETDLDDHEAETVFRRTCHQMGRVEEIERIERDVKEGKYS